MFECIIIDKIICPHKDISGNICSECTIPDDADFCPVCGMRNTHHELSINSGHCFNCSYPIEKERE